MSTKSSNSHHKRRRQERETRWTDPSLLQEEGEGREKHYATITKEARAGVRKTKSFRSFHKTARRRCARPSTSQRSLLTFIYSLLELS
mmetsp:Transcript_14112/g.34148  ORF Transcript_14112/g.34148 Transcript_14112/m.34148 type:complete len:88 (-) Transcript_14112:40-303(-)